MRKNCTGDSGLLVTAAASLRARIRATFVGNSVRGRFARGAAWMVLGGLAGQVISAAGSVVVARLLGKVRLGELGMLLSTIGMFNLVAELSLGVTASKHVAQYRTSDPNRAGRILGLAHITGWLSGLVTAGLVFLLAGLLADRALAAPNLAPYLRLASPVLLLTALSGVQSGALVGIEAFRPLSSRRIVLTSVQTLLGIVGVWAYGIAGALLASLVSGVIGLLWIRQLLLHECRGRGIAISYRGVGRESSILWRFALPSMMSGLLFTPVLWAANALLVRMPGGFGELGAFNAANQWRTLILWVPGILGSVTLPMLSTFLAEGNASRYVRTLKVNLLINVAVGLAVALPISLAAPWIMAMYGRGFRDSWLALVALCFAGVLQGAGHVVGSALTSLGRMWWGFALNGIWAIEILTATVLLRHRGAIGLAEAYLISYVLHTLQTAVLTFVVLPRHIRRVGVRSETSCGG